MTTTKKKPTSKKAADPIKVMIKVLQSHEPLGLVALVAKDEHLMKLIAAWPELKITRRSANAIKQPAQKYGIPDIRDFMWAEFDIDIDPIIEQIEKRFGHSFPARFKLNQAISNMLVFPDGTVHQKAKEIIEKKRTRIINELTGDCLVG